MKTFFKKKPREFEVGNNKKFQMKDCGEILLDTNEQVTFKNNENMEYDVAKKDWGYYATPSINWRLKNFGFKTLLIKNLKTNRFFIFLLEKGKSKLLNEYIKNENLKIICDLDNEENLSKIESINF